MPDRLWLAAGLIVLVAVLTAGVAQPAGAQEPAGGPVDLGAYGEPVRFTSPSGTAIEVVDRGTYVGAVEALPGPDSQLVLVNELTLQAYVEGIAEMPARWPMEALKAQAVAARTYGWFEAAQGRWERWGFDICATTACQVFRGREVVRTPVVGQRWAEAVAATQGEVLLWEGDPILARYFSTSGGQTRNNEHVFPGEGPRPYLKGVEDPDDAVSPFHAWEVEFTRDQLNAVFARGQQLSGVTPFAEIEHLTSPEGGADQVRVAGVNGEEVIVSASEFRRFVSAVAPDLFPGEYPSSRQDGGTLPTTLPSSRFDVDVDDRRVVFDGRGWGHGVGMGQYGARGKAERGLDYREILASYYNGLEPVRTPDAPERLRVGVNRDAGTVAVRSKDPLVVSVGGRTLTDRALGTWRISERPDGAVGLVGPSGYGAPLIVAPTTVSRNRPTSLEVITVETVVNKASELRLEIEEGAGRSVMTRDLGVVDAGRHTARWALETPDGEPVPPGDYNVRLVATDEAGTAAGETTTVEVVDITIPARPAATLLADATSPGGAARPLIVALIVGVLLGAGAGTVLPARREPA